jgi:hypothetical protein
MFEVDPLDDLVVLSVGGRRGGLILTLNARMTSKGPEKSAVAAQSAAKKRVESAGESMNPCSSTADWGK